MAFYDEDLEQTTAVGRLLAASPAVRTGFLDKKAGWQEGLHNALTKARPDLSPLRSRVLVAAILGALDAASEAWMADPKAAPLAGLAQQSFDELRTL